MPNMTEIGVGTAVVGGTLAMAGLTGGLGILIGSAVAGAAAYAVHDGIVGGMYEDAAKNLKTELADCKDEARAAELRCSVERMNAETAMVKAASVGLGVSTFICPPVGLMATAALGIGLARRLW